MSTPRRAVQEQPGMGRSAFSARIRNSSPSSRASNRPPTCGSAAPTAACPPTRSSDCCPGDIFVHRNLANMVVHTDLNCLSVMQFAVDILKVKHIIVVGHYGCSGVQAAMRRSRVGLADNWLRHVQDVHEKHQHIARVPAPAKAPRRTACASSTSSNRCRTSARPRSRATRGSAARSCHVHGWIYGIADGLARDLAHHGFRLPRSRAGVPVRARQARRATAREA